MFSLRLTCSADKVDALSGELWEAGTTGIRELDDGEKTILIAFFKSESARRQLSERFARFAPEWKLEEPRDWCRESRNSWLARPIGQRLFIAPLWCQDATPPDRTRIVHNPGLACGTGEHPCTQMALMALEKAVFPGCRVIDIGTGSGLLAIAAAKLGAAAAIGVDTDVAALSVAHENFLRNAVPPLLSAGSADCLASDCSDVTVANISGTVLLSALDDLRRVTRQEGCLILTGFPEAELSVFQRQFPGAKTTASGEWRCITAKLSCEA